MDPSRVSAGTRDRPTRRRADVTPGSLPPGSSLSPLLQTRLWIRRPLGFLERCRSRYGDVFTMRLVGSPALIMLSDPQSIREVFTGDPNVFRSGEGNALLRAALGSRSLLVLDGDRHLRERRLMLPPFHGDRMGRYRELIAGIAEREIASWPAATPFELAPRMHAIALEVITRAVFGVEEEQHRVRLERALSRLLDAATRPLRLFVLLLLAPDGPTVRAWRQHAPTIRTVDALLRDEIRRRRAEQASGREDILSLLLLARDQDGRPLSDEHLRDELMTLLVAGHETTAAALAWAFERLARRPEAFERLAGEEGNEYADAVAKETLRVRPVIPFVVRQLSAPVTLAGYALPAGVRVAPCVHLVHRRPDLYPEPETFRPERFLERPAGTYTWIPFGGGTRRCLGGALALFEMKTVLHAVASAGRLRPVEPRDEAIGRRGLSLTPARGARLLWESSPA